MAETVRRIVLELLARNKAAGDLAAFQAGMARVDQSIMHLARNALAFAGVGGGIYGVLRGLQSVTREAVGFEYGLAKVSTMLDASSMHHLPRLRNEIERMSVEYGKSTRDLNEAMYSILSSQIAASDATKVLETNIRAAKGGFTDTAVTVRATVGLLKAYQLETDQAAYVTNILHKIVNRGLLTFQDVAENIGTVSSGAAALGVDLEALGAAITTMTRAGVPVERAFTAMRNILATFRDPTDDAIRVAKALGFELDHTSIKGAGLITIIQKLTKANAQQLGVLMPNLRGFEGFTALLKAAAAAGEDYAYMLSDVQADQENFAKADAIMQSQLDKSRETWNLLRRDIGEGIGPALVDLTRVLTENKDEWRDFINTQVRGLSEILSGFESIGIVLDQVNRKITEGGKRPIPGAWGFTPQQMADMSRRAQALGAWPWSERRLPEGTLEISPRQVQVLAEMRAQARLIEEAISFRGPWPGTEGATALEQAAKQTKEISSYTDELIAKMKRENELLSMGIEEREKAKAIDKLRAEAQRDYNLGNRESIDLTAEEVEQVGQLAEEHYKLSSVAKVTTLDIAQAYVRMYDEIDAKSAESFEARRRLMELEYEEYAKVIDDQIALAEYRHQMEEKLAIERAKATGGPIEGIAAGVAQLERQIGGIGKLFYDMTVTGIPAFANALGDAVFEAKDLGDAIKEVGRQMARMAFEWAVQRAMLSVLGPVFPMPAAHRGGIVGVTPFATKMVAPEVFAGAPRLHGGLAANEFPAILERGERVIPKSGSAANGLGSGRIESLLGQILSVLNQRQTLNATIVDHRNVVTREQMEGRDGEQLIMHHVGRNR